VDAVYVVLLWTTADNLSRASGNLHIEAGWQDAGKTVRAFVSNNIWRAPIAAAALGGLMTLLFNLMSCFVLIRCGACLGTRCWEGCCIAARGGTGLLSRYATPSSRVCP
jgi:hypothetical protein